jgi:SAM-dependent methyltransferase
MPALYDSIGRTYASSRRADPAIAHALARELCLKPAGNYLDLGCGTGNYTVALSGLGGEWSAIDVSEVMLRQAREKSTGIAWIHSSADAIPFPEAAFDGAICTLAIHHFSSLKSPFCEVRRTLRSGPFVIFTGLAEQMRHYWLCHYFPEMMARSIDKMPAECEIRTSLNEAGFNSVAVKPFFVTNALEDLFLYSGKHRPELYLDPAIRANISSFADLAHTTEVQDGLARLALDVHSGAFAAVKARYDTEAGDYAFITAQIDD